MKVEVLYDICCDVCFDHYSSSNGFVRGSKNAMKKIAKEKGWTFKDGKNICPLCK